MVTGGAASGGAIHSTRDVGELRMWRLLHWGAGAEQTQGGCGWGASCRAAGLLTSRVTFQVPPII